MKYKRAAGQGAVAKRRSMKKTISSIIIVLLIITICMPTAFAKVEKTPDGKTKYTFTVAEINEMIRVVYAEARNQPFYGKVGVAQTITNRYKNNKGKYSIHYLTRRSQYAKAGKWILTSKRKGVIASVKECRKAVMYAINNQVFPTNCTMFQRANRKYWGHSKNKPRYCRIGAHTFYTVGKAKEPPNALYIDTDGKLKVHSGKIIKK
jgi:spore germination cell wall hydrolase CwlJ-like protein